MFSDILAQLKNPTTELIDRSKNEDTKMGAIKLAMISFVISALNIITSVLAIFNKYTEKNYSWYSKEKLAKLRSDALGELEIVKTFFQSWLMIAIAIVVIALILFIISKLVKSSQEYSTTLSMVNNVLIIYVIGSILTEDSVK